MTQNLTLSRRRFVSHSLALATTLQLQRAARALGLPPASEVCKLTPEQEVGPYYVADELLRPSVAEGKPGIPLSLRLVVLDARTCQPLPSAALDLWHCDGLGLYSGYTKQNPMGPGGPGGGPGGPGGGPGGPPPGFDPEHPGNHPGPPEGFGPPPFNKPSDHLTFCRGIQITDREGVATFQTIFPGFYQGRTNHIHFKVRLGGDQTHIAGKPTAAHTYTAGHTSHIGQVFFPEDLATTLMAHPPYSGHHIHRTTTAEDGVFNSQHGDLSIARITPLQPNNPAAGYHADLIAAVDPTATPAPAQRMGGPGGPPPPR